MRNGAVLAAAAAGAGQFEGMITPASLAADGWAARRSGGFNAAVEPFWIREAEGVPETGILIEDRHCNTNLGTIHGAVVMALADIALGLGAAHACGHQNLVTAQLSVQYLRTAPAGAFIHCRPEVVRQTRQLVFVRGLLCANNQNIASAEGIWKVISPRIR